MIDPADRVVRAIARLWTLIVVSRVLIAIDNLISIKLTRWMWRPVWAWEGGARDPASTSAAWTTLATLPLEYTRLMRRYPVFFVYLPFIAFTTWTLHLHWYSALKGQRAPVDLWAPRVLLSVAD
jgi:hypothetical protein